MRSSVDPDLAPGDVGWPSDRGRFEIGLQRIGCPGAMEVLLGWVIAVYDVSGLELSGSRLPMPEIGSASCEAGG
jgi:hypothetical protein